MQHYQRNCWSDWLNSQIFNIGDVKPCGIRSPEHMIFSKSYLHGDQRNCMITVQDNPPTLQLSNSRQLCDQSAKISHLKYKLSKQQIIAIEQFDYTVTMKDLFLLAWLLKVCQACTESHLKMRGKVCLFPSIAHKTRCVIHNGPAINLISTINIVW